MRPSVLSYTRKNDSLNFSLIRLDTFGEGFPDNLLLSLKVFNSPQILLINKFNAPLGVVMSGFVIKYLFSLPGYSLYSNNILRDDFNLHHQNWQPSYLGTPSTESEPFISWLDFYNLS